MSTLEVVTAGLAAAGAIVAVAGLGAHVFMTQRRPFRGDVAPAKGSATKGVIYAFTEGMAPWAKESTRRHAVAYLRGIVFHAAIFVGVALLIASPWLGDLPTPVRATAAVVLTIGATTGLAGFWIRASEPALRRLSTPDDYASLALVTLFLGTGASAAALTSLIPAFWVASGVLLAYVPAGKIRHCIYFFYGRTFFGLFFGRRGVLESAR